MTSTPLATGLPSSPPGSAMEYVTRPALEEQVRSSLAPGAAVVLLGPAGIGKSRLAARVLEGRTRVAVSAATPLHVDAGSLLATLVEQAGPGGSGLLSMLRDSGSGGSDEVLRAAACWVGARAEVVLLEDAEHLGDDDAGLVAAAAAVSGIPWLLTSRRRLPVLEATSLELPPFEQGAGRQLVRHLLPGASPDLTDLVVRRGEGNPLHLEQCARLLLENGAVVVEPTGSRLARPDRVRDVPVSLRDFVLSRLRLLPPIERQFLCTAAVLGESPDVDLLTHLVGGGPEVVEALLSRLAARGLLRLSTQMAGQPQMAFSHSLVRDVAYGELDVGERVDFHRAAAEWYAVLPVVQVLESQAHHLEAAVRLGGADCDLLRRAVEAMVLFARSVEIERTRVSHDVLSRSRELVVEHPQCRLDTLQLELGQAVVALTMGDHEDAHAAAGRALDLARESRDTAAEAAARLSLARVCRSSDPTTSLGHLDAAEALFALVGDDAGLARVEVERSWVAQRERGIAQQLAHMEQAYQLALRSGEPRLQAAAAQDLAMHHAFATGRLGFEQWSARARECSRAEDVSLEPKLAVAEAFLAVFELAPRAGFEASTTALRAATELGLSFVLRNALTTQLDLLVLDGGLAQAEELLAEARLVADRQVTQWQHLQYSLIEARLRQRQGDPARAHAILDDVARHELADRKVMRRDLAEARAWVALECGRFEEARALAGQAVLLDEEMDERCAPLRPRLVDVVATVAQGQEPSLGDLAALRASCRESGLTTVAELMNRWLLVEDLRRGWTVDLYHLDDVDVVEAHALDLEIEALSTRSFDRLLEAAEVWGELGTTVWHARSLLWHSELTGTPHPEADELLQVLQSPPGLAEHFRAQVRGLRA